jgi:hypothetical protein
MENIKNISNPTDTAAAPPNSYKKTKAYQDFNVLSQIIEKHGAEVLNEINHEK